jgi:uncharacterized protein YndB with AHSA1/START domain
MPNIHHEIIIGASADKVYKSITSEEALSAWWTPNTSAKAEINSVARFPFGKDYYKEMKITELKPLELVKWHCIRGHSEWLETNISFKLISGDKASLQFSNPEIRGQLEQQSNDVATLLVFHHNDWKEYSPMFAECNYTWGQFLRSLKLFCETGKGTPSPNQHRIEL